MDGGGSWRERQSWLGSKEGKRAIERVMEAVIMRKAHRGLLDERPSWWISGDRRSLGDGMALVGLRFT